jgi:arylsulfatase A-like enzyme
MWGSSATILLALTLSIPIGCREGRPSRPDVILITLDTTRVDHLGAYGYERQITSQIDHFAKDSVLYRRAWSTSSWTLPAHASIFTGKHPTSHGAVFNTKTGDVTLGEALEGAVFHEIKVNRLGENQTTLAELLQEAGYETAAFAGGPWMSPVFGLLQGYAVRDARIRSIEGRRADLLTDHAIAWLQEVPRERPIHLLVNYFDPHRPYTPPRGYDDLPHAREQSYVSDLAVIQGTPLPPSQRAILLDRYDGEIRFMDHHVGRLLGALQAVDRYDNALIVVLSDHGETFGEHNLMEHGRWLYEEVLRVPLLVRFPGGRGSGTAVDDPVSVVDLLPMIAHEVGFSLPPGVEGVPIGRRGLVLGESFRDALAIKLWGPRFNRDLITGVRWPWKLIMSDGGFLELYRLDEDPEELQNLADGKTENDLKRDVERAVEAFRPPGIQSAPQNVTPETKEHLRALGYIE